MALKNLKPGLVASYDILPGNGEVLLLFRRFINLSLTYLLRHLPTHLQPRDPHGDSGQLTVNGVVRWEAPANQWLWFHSTWVNAQHCFNEWLQQTLTKCYTVICKLEANASHGTSKLTCFVNISKVNLINANQFISYNQWIKKNEPRAAHFRPAF